MSGANDGRKTVLLAFDPYERVDEQYCAADRWGASAVRHDLVQHLVEHGAVDEVFLVRPVGNPSPVQAALDYLRDRVGNVVSHGTPDALLTLQDRARLVCIHSMEKMPRVCRIRRLLAMRFPILGLLHTLPGPAIAGLYHWLTAEALDRDAIVATSRAANDALRTILDGVERGGRRPPLDVRLVPLGVDERLFGHLTRDAARRTLGLAVDGPIVLWVGRFSETFKADLEPLLRTFGALCRAANATLVCAGSDTEGYAARLAILADAEGFGDRVVFIRNFPLTLKPAIYAAGDVFVSIADNVQESFGVTLLEAMAAGLPVIASDWSGYRDIVAHGDTGYLLDTEWLEGATETAAEIAWTLNGAGDRASGVLARATVVSRQQLGQALRRTLNDPGLRARLGANGAERARRLFAWSVVSRAYRALIDEKCRMAAETPRFDPLVTVADVFRRYATTTVASSARWIAVDGGQESDRLDHLAANDQQRQAARRALDAVRRAGARAPAGMARGDEELDADVAAWLVKKGLCARTPGTSAPR